jgi:hypothetical protein
MRGGRRLPALMVAIGLLTGCSDPAGAVRRERAASRAHSTPSPKPSSPSPTPTSTQRAAGRAWWQAPSTIRSVHGLRVHTGALRDGRIRVIVTDLTDRASHSFTATTQPRTMKAGHFTLAGVRVVKSPKTQAPGLGFRYRPS